MKSLSFGLPARVFLVAGFMLASVAASAQPASKGQPTRLRGTVQKLDGDTLTVLSNANMAIKVMLPPKIQVLGMARRSLSDIKDGEFVGVTAAKGKDGDLHATEVHIFPDSMRGAGEGHYAWDVPNTTMTNATVAGETTASNGRTLKLAYKGGQTKIDVSPDTPIVTFVPGDKTLLKPGAAVFVMGTAKPNGTIDAFSVTAEKNGVKPPM
ncbi:MAG TPA: hypothetical protein VKA19_09545 [Alphaproteobacteria bacterium]|nr:hypothetical protein [Alphaproteobacteria bacterium]